MSDPEELTKGPFARAEAMTENKKQLRFAEIFFIDFFVNLLLALGENNFDIDTALVTLDQYWRAKKNALTKQSPGDPQSAAVIEDMLKGTVNQIGV